MQTLFGIVFNPRCLQLVINLCAVHNLTCLEPCPAACAAFATPPETQTFANNPTPNQLTWPVFAYTAVSERIDPKVPFTAEAGKKPPVTPTYMSFVGEAQTNDTCAVSYWINYKYTIWIKMLSFHSLEQLVASLLASWKNCKRNHMRCTEKRLESIMPWKVWSFSSDVLIILEIRQSTGVVVERMERILS